MSQGIPLSSHLLPSYIIFKATLLNFSQKAMQETLTTKLKLNMCERAVHSIIGLEWRTHTERNQVELVANAKRQTSMCECGERRGWAIGDGRWEMAGVSEMAMANSQDSKEAKAPEKRPRGSWRQKRKRKNPNISKGRRAIGSGRKSMTAQHILKWVESFGWFLAGLWNGHTLKSDTYADSVKILDIYCM